LGKFGVRVSLEPLSIAMQGCEIWNTIVEQLEHFERGEDTFLVQPVENFLARALKSRWIFILSAICFAVSVVLEY